MLGDKKKQNKTKTNLFLLIHKVKCYLYGDTVTYINYMKQNIICYP